MNSESGSSSSGSGSERSGSEKSLDRSHHSDDTKSSPKHSNANSSKSDHHTDKNTSDEDSPSKSKSRNSKLKSDLWEDNPDIYGIRRSARSRKEPDRLKLADSDSSERGRTHSRKSRKKR